MTHSKRQEIIERRRRKQRQQRITTVLIISGAALVFVAVWMLAKFRPGEGAVVEFIQPPLNPRPMANANAMGDPNAPVVFQDFSDFGCGYCAKFAQDTAEKIVETYVASGQVYFVFHSVGSLLGHPASVITAEAAYCAGDQNKFWEFHDLIFANQAPLYRDPNLDVEKMMMAFAEALELDVGAFETCLDTGKYRDQVTQDEIDARRAGIDSTPSFLINGTKIVGARSFEEFQAVIEAELAKAGY